ncbi:shikimate dehydrogenase family protein [Leucobacter sp. UCMA 4100]|uniref:shikimate dehydrogenase family protein n=1 Tax=Leucobacter sp. UCMA 4100 TaxID=2810534 RepID=UPI0022EB597E|nr:shikimate dehydrogenase [Leucobacter sp. UCMA 4100]
MRRLAVLGSPIAHSKSPLIHAAAYAEMGLEWQYERIECTESELAPLLTGLSNDWLGFSCTMPLKTRARELADVLDPVAQASGVVNTLARHEAGWIGANTDVGGLRMALESHGLDLTRTLVLGAGATAVSAVLAARAGGAAEVQVMARRPEAAEALGRAYAAVPGTLGHEPVWLPTAVVSTLPGPAGADLVLPETVTQAPLFDVAYDPWPSPLSKVWDDRGSDRYPGIDMLIFQAVLQIRLFVSGSTGAKLEGEERVIATMREAVASSVEE